MRVWSRRALAILSALPLGCATIVHGGNRQTVSITSTPPGATATIDGTTTVQTPATIELKRNKDHVVVIEKPGYQPTTVLVDRELSAWIWGNIFLPTLLVDFITGGAYHLESADVGVRLTPTNTISATAPVMP